MAGSENSPENLAECHPSGAYGWLSPRISFSTDFGLGSPRREQQQQQQHQQPPMDEWSQEFEFSLAIECPCGSPADEIFYQGKLLPLQLLEQSGPGIHLVKELLLQEASVTGSVTGIGTGTSSSDRSCDSSGCTSPLFVPASPSKLPSCAAAFKDLFGLRRRNNRYSLRLLSLFFRRHMLGVPASHPVGLPEKENETPEKNPAASDDSLANSSTLPPGTGTSTTEVGNSSRSSESVHVITETSTPTPPPTTTTSGVRGEASESTTATAGSKQVRGNATMNSGRILWKNLERCSKSCGKGGVRKHVGGSGAGSGASSGSAFSSNVRVAPVLNVPMCMGPVKETKSTMAGLRKFFTVKKESLHRVTWACPGGAI